MPRSPLLLANVRGINSKTKSLKSILATENPDLMGLCETHTMSDRNLNIPGYKFIGRPRVNKQGAGVGILIAESIVNQITLHKIDENLELIWIIIKTSKHSPVYFGIYYYVHFQPCLHINT